MERLRLADAQPIVGNLKRTSTYAFVIERYTPFKDWDDEDAKAHGAMEEMGEAFGTITAAIDKETAASRMSYRDAAKLVEDYSQDQIEQLDSVRKIQEAHYLIHQRLIATSDPVTAEERQQHAAALRVWDERTDDAGSAVKVAYDADRAGFDITIQTDIPSITGGSTLRLSSGPAKNRVYTASNEFGAVQQVKEYSFKEYNLLITNSANIPFLATMVPRRVRVDVPISLEKAEMAKPELEAIAICKLTAPFVASRKIDKEPTHDDPTSVQIDQRYLTARILAIWIYNHDTGAVYARILPTD
jgi:hypothetical protein